MPTPIEPYLIYGTAYNNDNTTVAGSAALTLQNETTAQTLTFTTNSLGQFVFDLANLASGYSDGDYITVSVDGGGTNGKDLRIRIVYFNIGQINEIDVHYTTS